MIYKTVRIIYVTIITNNSRKTYGPKTISFKKMFEDECGTGGFGLTFEKLEKEEAAKSTKSLLDIDDRLYSPLGNDVTLNPAIDAEPNDNTRRYYSEGYEANYEGVEDSEIRQWQRSPFNFLRVTGRSLQLPTKNLQLAFPPNKISSQLTKDIHSESDPYFVEIMDGILPRLEENDYLGELVVTGKAIFQQNVFDETTVMKTKNPSVIYGAVIDTGDNDYHIVNSDHPQFASSLCSQSLECEDEVLAMDGILEEYLEYSGESVTISEETTDQKGNTNLDVAGGGSGCGGCVEPSASKRDEVISSLVDAIWPDVVQSMVPLIKKVLIAARENNIPHVVQQQESTVESEGRGSGGFDFNSDYGDDDGWG